MPAQISKQAIDLGVVISDADASLRFYRDTLGLEYVAEVPLPQIGSPGIMHRLQCGETVVKLLVLDTPPPAKSPPGGPASALGYRYFTIPVTNLEELVAEVEAAGYGVPVPPMEARPGLQIAMVEDPDGNWVEFIQAT
jgi:catechol 2,3-dioxygenase-like lactoylglutathione lyase family enzyme